MAKIKYSTADYSSILAASLVLGVGGCVFVISLPDKMAPIFVSAYMVAISALLFWNSYKASTKKMMQYILLSLHILTAIGILVLMQIYSPMWFFWVWSSLIVACSSMSLYSLVVGRGIT